ncbi:S41 family peptidase [Patescibacteria group bacterium]|nr:S41 family peptidase [Patescibacteria group bacterium]
MYARKHVIFMSVGFILFFLFGWKGAEFHYTSQNLLIRADQGLQENSLDTSNTGNTVDMNLYLDVRDEIELNYVDLEKAFDDENLLYGSIKGMVGSLDDPYTVFMNPEETKQFEDNLNGSLDGIGAELTVEDGFLKVVSPLKDSPAEAAGLKPGDIIFKIDGEITSEMTLFDAIMNIRGARGTSVVLTIIRENEVDPLEIEIIRDEILIESVTFEMMESDIAYISLNQFTDNTTAEFEEAVREILLNNPKGLILDLRYNGGGYLDIAVEIVSEFIDGYVPAVSMKTRHIAEDEIFYVKNNAKLGTLPLVVLVNNGSASAAEILAGAIQDHKRGIIMGEQTFGKGSVQEVIFLNDGSSLRMTIAKWLTPSGRDIDEVGIMPDRIIELTKEDMLAENDTQLNEALEYLNNL